MRSETRTHCAIIYCISGRSDHRVTDFPGYEPTEFRRRRELARAARRSFSGKVIALYTSVFCELALGYPICPPPPPEYLLSQCANLVR